MSEDQESRAFCGFVNQSGVAVKHMFIRKVTSFVHVALLVMTRSFSGQINHICAQLMFAVGPWQRPVLPVSKCFYVKHVSTVGTTVGLRPQDEIFLLRDSRLKRYEQPCAVLSNEAWVATNPLHYQLDFLGAKRIFDSGQALQGMQTWRFVPA